MRFVPTAGGTRTATLTVGSATVALEGDARPGVTRVDLEAQMGAWVHPGDGQHAWSYTPANAAITARGSPETVVVAVETPAGTWWQGTFSAGRGEVLAPGRYQNVRRYSPQGTGPGLDVVAGAQHCEALTGEFTVTEASFDVDGDLLTFGASFIQRCEGLVGVTSGTFAFRAANPPRRPVPPPPLPEVPRVMKPPPPPPQPAAQDPTAPASAVLALAVPDVTDPGPSELALPVIAAGARPAASDSVARAARSGACAARRFAVRRARVGLASAEAMTGTRLDERFFAGAGDDRIRAGGGDDCVDGGAGADRIDGGAGADLLLGGAGDDTLSGGPGRDVLDCGPGRDVARVTTGDRVRGCERVVAADRNQQGG